MNRFRRPLIAATLIALAAVATLLAPSPALARPTSATSTLGAPAPTPALAPADEYFGPLAMSVLGIRNELDRLRVRLDASRRGAGSALVLARQIARSIHAWEARYPKDPWIGVQLLALLHVYAHVGSPQGHQSELHCLAWILAKYPAQSDAALAIVTGAADRLQARLTNAALVGDLAPSGAKR